MQSVNEEGVLETLSNRYICLLVHTYVQCILYPCIPSDTSSGFWKLCLTEDSSRRRLKLVANSLGTTHLQASRNKGILAYEYFIFSSNQFG